MVRHLAAASLCLLTVGCAALSVQRPTAAVTGMAVQDVTAAGFTMNFGIDLTNPNAFALPLTAADYKVGLGGVGVADGRATPDASLPANGSATVSVPVTLTYDGLLAADQAIVKTGGNVPYTFDGGLSFGTHNPLLGDLRVPISTTGVLPLRDVLNNPQAVLQSPAARKLAQDLLDGLFGR
jgi:LEA14-like dessication related protein